MTYKVLLLDDDSRFRRMVVPGLLSKGFDVTEVISGREAQEHIEKESFDLLIIDGLLPDTDGIALITKYRASGGRTPIVFISGRWQTPDLYRLLTQELEVLQVIHKPVIPQVFAEQIYSALNSPQAEPLPVEDISLDHSLEEISREYWNELPAELDTICDTLANARDDIDRSENLKSLRLKCHRLRGTAGSFGLQELGEIMGAIEDGVRNADLSMLEPAFFDRIKESVDYARELLRQHEDKRSKQKNKKTTEEQIRSVSELLVIDQDEEFLEFVEQLARQRLIRVHKSRSADEALLCLKKRTVDAILLDVDATSKPLDLVRSIREVTAENVPLAVISDESGLEERLLATQLGASLFLKKPIDPDTLEDALQRLTILGSRERPKILLLDDDLFFSARVTHILQERGMDVHSFHDPTLILEKLEEVNPDILLLDLMMPKISGFEICKMLRTVPSWQDLPIILVTAQTGLDTRIAAFASGADEYLPKPLADEELIARVALRVERSRLLKERRERDPVTGLLIRRSFMERFNALIASARRCLQPVSLVLFDIDYFKQVNDQHGHLAGDSTLSGLGRLMRKRFRVEDLRGRWGGDEFVLAFVGCDKSQSLNLMQKFLIEFSQIEFRSDSGEKFKATLSAGIACFPDDSDNTYDLFRIADSRLYEAKARGRNRAIAVSEAGILGE